MPYQNHLGNFKRKREGKCVMYVIINGKYLGDFANKTEVERHLQAYEKAEAACKNKISLGPLESYKFENEYAEKNILGLVREVRVQIVKDLEKFQTYLLSDMGIYDEKINRMLDALNEIGKNQQYADQNIYVVQDDVVVGKTEKLTSANDFLRSYLDKNAQGNKGAYFEPFMCVSKEEINRDNTGHFNAFYFTGADGKTSGFSFIYPLEVYKRYINILQKEQTIQVVRSLKKDEAILAQLKKPEDIPAIDTISVKAIRADIQQAKADQQLYKNIQEKYKEYSRYKEWQAKLQSRIKEVKTTGKQIQALVRNVCYRPANKKWIISQYNSEITETAKKIKDITALDSVAYKRMATRCLLEHEKDSELVTTFVELNSQIARLQKQQQDLAEQVSASWAALKELERDYQNINPSFRLESLELDKFSSVAREGHD